MTIVPPRPRPQSSKDLPEDRVTDQGTADTVLEDLSEGVRHHQAGRLKEAEAVYRRILEAHPENADAKPRPGGE